MELKDITKEWLIEQNQVFEKSCVTIAKELKVTPRTIQSRFKRFNLKVLRFPLKHKDKYINLVGREFEHFTVISRFYQDSKNHKYLKYVCRCKCGKEFITYSGFILSGVRRSCGCNNFMGLKHGNTKYNDPKKATYIRLINRYKQTARRANKDWELSIEESIKLFLGRCFYCGTEPNRIYIGYRNTKNIKRMEESQIVYNGIDRVNNNIGYNITNCVSCCTHCNTAKLTLTREEFLNWARKVVKHNENNSNI